MTNSSPIKPLFMWAGGKSAVIRKPSFFMMPTPKEKYTTYMEPFLGGGAMFLKVMSEYPIREAVLGDSYPGIMNVYRQIKERPEEFIRIMDELQARYIPLDKPGRKAMYYEVRDRHAWEYEAAGEVEEAAMHYFLQRTGFNGVLQINKNTNHRFGTPAGLLNQKKEVYDADNVRAWSNLLQAAYLHTGDYTEAPCDRPDFIFLDPPYRGASIGYGTPWTDEDHERLINWIHERIGSYVICCNRTEPGGDWFYTSRRGVLNGLTLPSIHTAGRKKKDEDGNYSAYSSGEVFLYGEVVKRNRAS